VITYPIMLNLQARPVLVVGGGRVGLRKALALAAAGAKVTLVAGKTGPKDNRGDPNITTLAEDYDSRHVQGAVLVLACTDDHHVNRRVADNARRAGALVNVADCPELCDFFLPAAARDGDVVLAVGTGGAAPSLAVRLRDELAAALPGGSGEFAAVLARLRDKVQAGVADAARRQEMMRKLASRETFDLFRGKGEQAVIELADILVSGRTG